MNAHTQCVNWINENSSSAFTPSEIQVLVDWGQCGASLWLLADHMLMAGVAAELGAAFGFPFTDGFVFDTTSQGSAIFSLENGVMKASIIFMCTLKGFYNRLIFTAAFCEIDPCYPLRKGMGRYTERLNLPLLISYC
ncbi:MAG: hypothetical protein AAF694_24995 [Bacteroidota bacterium]